MDNNIKEKESDEIIWLQNSLNVYKKALSIAIKHNKEHKIIEYREEIKKIISEIDKLKVL